MRTWPLLTLLAGPTLFGGVHDLAAQTLEDALVAAYLTNPNLEAQRAALRATDELVPQALDGWRPTVGVDSGVAYNDVDSSVGGDTFTSTSNSLTLDQELYSGGETVANTERAERLVRLERARLQAIEQDVLLDAVTVYTNLLAAQAVLDFAIQNETRLTRQLQATRDRFEVGEVTRTDVAQAEARFSGATADRVQAEGALSVAEADYRRVINQEPGTLVVPQPLGALPANELEAQQLSEVANPNVVAAQFDLAASRSEVDVARSALLPRLSVRGELTYTDDPTATLEWRRDAIVGANLRVPLYQGGGEYARVRQTKQTVRQRQNDLEATFRAVRNEVTNAWESLVTATTRIDSIAAQVRASEIAVEGSRQEALVGQRTTLDVLDQENDLFQAQVDLVQARRDQIVASYRLKAAVGELTVVGLSLPVEPYESEAYYANVRNRWIGLGGDVVGD
ncbi:MAG: type secretion outer membrane protein TolC family [Geminicoccaceae bacterium]|jgi:TolC family type I secretion outer membrane protein|nr:type secretion outer membrane protein TolC family [Geminicoccaceae bacterium]